MSDLPPEAFETVAFRDRPAAPPSAGDAEADHLEGVGRALAFLEAHGDPLVGEQARALVQGMLTLHRAGLRRLLGHLPGGAPPAAASADGIVSNLLALHGLHPEALDPRVARAADEADRLLAVHQGAVTLEVDEDGARRLRVRAGTRGRAQAEEVLADALARHAPDAPELDLEWEGSEP